MIITNVETARRAVSGHKREESPDPALRPSRGTPCGRRCVRLPVRTNPQITLAAVPRVHRGIAVVAVGAVFHVPVGRVSGLLRARQRVGAGVGVAVPIAVAIGAEQDEILVHTAVAVVVHAVADFGGSGVHPIVPVVAVGGVRHVPGRSRARRVGRGGVAVAIPVAVRVEDAGDAFVRAAIAVVVRTVAHFGFARVQAGVAVVAVGTHVVAVSVVVAVVRAPRTVVVHPVAPFDVAGVGIVVRVVAVGVVGGVAGGLTAGRGADGHVAVAIVIRVHVPREGVHSAVVHHAIAVVVHAVARLEFPGVDSGVGVVAVGEVEDVAGGRGAVARSGGDGGIAEAVAVGIGVGTGPRETVVRAAAAVVVHPVARLHFRGVDSRIGVVAV